ncbi:MAG TPA: polyphosphate kinase 1 [Candidatus Acidoferrum sp.]|nr:polyphosphate kinase 1 [Candidatus Acidoferrum sp.]
MVVKRQSKPVSTQAPKQAVEVLDDPSLYLNRELAQLAFNQRVLAQAKDAAHPLLERLRFLCITSSNLDEFFEIRVSGLKQQQEFGASQLGPDRMPVAQQLRAIHAQVQHILDEQYDVLYGELLPALAKEGITLLRPGSWNPREAQWIKRYFNRELSPVLSPIALDPAHPFPKLSNKSLNFLVSLEGNDAFGRNSPIAIVQAPRALPRVFVIPDKGRGKVMSLVLLSSIIQLHMQDLFQGMKVTGCFQFRITRNSDLYLDDEEVEDVMQAVQGELQQRRYGDAVRLEVAHDCPEHLVNFLRQQFELTEQDVYHCRGPVNLARLSQILDLLARADLKFPRFEPSLPKAFREQGNFFDAIRDSDVLLHHPFESFAPVVEFLQQAAHDPAVLAIKQTLYRTGPDSPIVAALIDAARNGKEVTVVIELMARFDEADNIALASKLQESGAHVVYGAVGHKTHSKMILVVRREGRVLRRYAHLGTGNYHPRTTSVYTDFGLFTADAVLCTDVQKVFHLLTAPGTKGKLSKILTSPFALHRQMLALIDAETERAQGGGEGRIIAKMNALVDVQVIQALYRASQAGVKIDLIVRGVCGLRPGIKGVSANIRVRSIVGRFLEHSRIYYFGNGGEPKVFLSSADWMQRNFFKRVETCFPIEDPALKKRVISEGLLTYLRDNRRAWLLKSDGTYQRSRSAGAARDAQQELLELLAK